MTGMLLAGIVSTAFSFGEVRLNCPEDNGWKISAAREELAPGVEVLKISLAADAKRNPPRFTVEMQRPQIDMYYRWSVNDSHFSMPPDWGGRLFSEYARHMPLYAFVNGNDQCSLALAASECSRHVQFSGGVREEGSVIDAKFTFFSQSEAPIDRYETAIRIDTRRHYFGEAIAQSARWIEQTGRYQPAPVPESAFDPLYSTWYNFHQNVFAKDIEEELAIAAGLGMKTVILDDGWQTDDSGRGYAFCGDWEVSSRRFPDMAAHVEKVHAMGMKYMVWYSVPFIGLKSKNYERFKGKYLIENLHGLNAAVLDPRFPEVRKFIVETYVKALKAWNIDGFKLDFINDFRFDGVDPAERDNYANRDIKTVPAAVDRLLLDVRTALVAIKKDILLEFRQSYVGPAVRQIGNMLRVGDCPGDMRRNRFAIANLRLASGGTAVHSDMLEWHFGEKPEDAALYIINSMFGVVQYSVMLRRAPESHRAMIAKWIKFSQDHRETLLKGRFRPHHPELQYPVIEAESDSERVIGLYDDGRVLDIPDGKKTFVMNASGKNSFVVRRGGKLSEIACASGDWIELP